MTEVLTNAGITNFIPKNIFEIGSRDGHDTNFLKQIFNISNSNCYIFEAHPDCYSFIKSTYPQFNVFNCGITNKTGTIKFNAGIVGEEGNIGMSSILKQNNNEFKSKEILVDGWRFDDICKQLNLLEIDIVKIDVEGHSLEVLEGFGTTLNHTKMIQIELEHDELWKNQATYDTVKDFLIKHDFIEIAFMRHSWSQSDSLWLNKKYVNK
jgi:FkbM family methyltransferase